MFTESECNQFIALVSLSLSLPFLLSSFQMLWGNIVYFTVCEESQIDQKQGKY